MSDEAVSSVSPRVASVDAYRGFVMLLMMAEVLHLGRVARALPDSPFWQFLAWHQSHAPWRGCSLHDLIQPSFSFLVGVALPFSLARRAAGTTSSGWLVLHAAWRAFVLVTLGIFLRSVGKPQTNFTFEDTLTQIGLGYLPLFVIGRAASPVAWVALAVILVGDWAAFAAYPAPGAGFDFAAVGVPADWPHHLTGFAAHWDKNANLAWAVDRWFLNLFPRPSPFLSNGGGYATLNFVPTLATMILGLIAGRWLQAGGAAWPTVRKLVTAGLVALTLGWFLDWSGVCPSVKRIWTPAWVLFSGGWCFLVLAAFYALLDTGGRSGWAYSLQVIGKNSIAAYCLAHLIDDFLVSSFTTHLGPKVFAVFGPAYESTLMGVAVLATFWAILWWMERRRLYLKV